MEGKKHIFLGLLGFTASVYLTVTILMPRAYILTGQRHASPVEFTETLKYVQNITDECSNFTLLEGLSIPNISSYPTNLTFVEELFQDVVNGSWSPAVCAPSQKLALIVPYRDRSEQLPLFLYHMNKFLQRQMRAYQVFLIEQSDSESFNRAALFNVGYEEARKVDDFTCYIFHDVDLLPENDELAYTCTKDVVRHFAELISNMNYTRIYAECAGGVVSFHTLDFQKINGFSNSYWGWGAEDDDLYKRIRQYNLAFEHQTDAQGRYTALRHSHVDINKRRFTILDGWKRRFKEDGLNSLVYNIVNQETTRLFVKISVDLQDLRNYVKKKWRV